MTFDFVESIQSGYIIFQWADLAIWRDMMLTSCWSVLCVHFSMLSFGYLMHVETPPSCSVAKWQKLVPPGTTLRCDVTGKILMKCFLSGMPDLKLGLNDKIGLEKEAQAKARPSRRLIPPLRVSIWLFSCFLSTFLFICFKLRGIWYSITLYFQFLQWEDYRTWWCHIPPVCQSYKIQCWEDSQFCSPRWRVWADEVSF